MKISSTHRIRAYMLVAQHLGADERDARRDLRLKYLGTSGGDHVIRDSEGRLFGVDLVTRNVVMYVGVPPKIERTR